jgi:hypothetical protein
MVDQFSEEKAQLLSDEIDRLLNPLIERTKITPLQLIYCLLLTTMGKSLDFLDTQFPIDFQSGLPKETSCLFSPEQADIYVMQLLEITNKFFVQNNLTYPQMSLLLQIFSKYLIQIASNMNNNEERNF